jgi:hypothetical protein
MNFNNPIARSGLPRFNESSSQRVIRDSDAVPRIWQKARSVQRNVQTIAAAVEAQQKLLQRMRRRKGGGDEAVGVVQLVVRRVEGDYLVCGPFVAVDALSSGADMFVAKNYKLRKSITTEIITGDTITYTGDLPTQRTATGSAGTETQVVVPAYLLEDSSDEDYPIFGDRILAISAATGVVTTVGDGEVTVGLLDLNIDGRAWAQA